MLASRVPLGVNNSFESHDSLPAKFRKVSHRSPKDSLQKFLTISSAFMHGSATIITDIANMCCRSLAVALHEISRAEPSKTGYGRTSILLP
jgi:hypothetical protein